MHVHQPPFEAQLYGLLFLAHGVTTVRNTGDLAALSTLEAVVAQGRLYPKAVLEAALARHREYFNGWLYDRLSMVFARWWAARTAIDEQ